MSFAAPANSRLGRQSSDESHQAPSTNSPRPESNVECRDATRDGKIAVTSHEEESFERAWMAVTASSALQRRRPRTLLTSPCWGSSRRPQGGA